MLSPRSKVFTVRIKSPRQHDGTPIWVKAFQHSKSGTLRSTKSLSVDVEVQPSEVGVLRSSKALSVSTLDSSIDPKTTSSNRQQRARRIFSDTSVENNASHKSACMSPLGKMRSIKIQSMDNHAGNNEGDPPPSEIVVRLFGPDGLTESDENKVVVSDIAEVVEGDDDDHDGDDFLHVSFNITVFDAPPDAEFHCQVTLPSNIGSQRLPSSRSGGTTAYLWKFLLLCLFLAPWTNAFLQAPAFKAARRLVTSNSWSPKAGDFDEFWPVPPMDGVFPSDKLGDLSEGLKGNMLPFPDETALSEHKSSAERVIKKSAKLIGIKSVQAKKGISETASTQDVRTVLAESAADFTSTLLSTVLTEVHPSLGGLTTVDDVRVAVTYILQNATHTALATEEKEGDLLKLLSSLKIPLVPKPADAASFFLRNALLPAATHRVVSSVVDNVVNTCEAVEGAIRCPGVHSHFFDTVLQIAHILPSVPAS